MKNTKMKLIKNNMTYTDVDYEIMKNDFEIIEIYQGSLVDEIFTYDHTNEKYFVYLEKYKNPWSSVLSKYEINENDFYKMIDDYDQKYEIYENIDEYDEK